MVTSKLFITEYNEYECRNWWAENIEWQKPWDRVVYAMSLLVETKDSYTAGHQRRVAELARAIAREMGLSDREVIDIHTAGLLHDIGKLAVPAEILSKPGKISKYEFGIIQNHSVVGHGILEKIEFPKTVTITVLQHHERLDGSGYPLRLFGDDIIFGARILAVADVVEATSSHRPYRPALGLDSALEEVKRQSGTLYDSDIVDACLKLFQNDELMFIKLMEAAVDNAYI